MITMTDGRIVCKEIKGNNVDGYVEFIRRDTGEKCYVLLTELSPDTLLFYPDGSLEMECRPSFRHFFADGLKTDLLTINVTSLFSLYFELIIDYRSDCLAIKCVRRLL